MRTLRGEESAKHTAMDTAENQSENDIKADFLEYVYSQRHGNQVLNNMKDSKSEFKASTRIATDF